MGIRWRKGWFPMWYAYCPTEKDFRREMRRAGHDDYPWPEHAGCCVAYDDAVGERRCLVVINADLDADPSVGIGLLVHECVHVVQWIVRTMVDDAPSDEFYAYSTQAVFQELLSDIAEYNARIRALQAS